MSTATQEDSVSTRVVGESLDVHHCRTIRKTNHILVRTCRETSSRQEDLLIPLEEVPLLGKSPS